MQRTPCSGLGFGRSSSYAWAAAAYVVSDISLTSGTHCEYPGKLQVVIMALALLSLRLVFDFRELVLRMARGNLHDYSVRYPSGRLPQTSLHKKRSRYAAGTTYFKFIMVDFSTSRMELVSSPQFQLCVATLVMTMHVLQPYEPITR